MVDGNARSRRSSSPARTRWYGRYRQVRQAQAGWQARVVRDDETRTSLLAQALKLVKEM